MDRLPAYSALRFQTIFGFLLPACHERDPRNLSSALRFSLDSICLRIIARTNSRIDETRNLHRSSVSMSVTHILKSPGYQTTKQLACGVFSLSGISKITSHSAHIFLYRYLVSFIYVQERKNLLFPSRDLLETGDFIFFVFFVSRAFAPRIKNS